MAFLAAKLSYNIDWRSDRRNRKNGAHRKVAQDEGHVPWTENRVQVSFSVRELGYMLGKGL